MDIKQQVINAFEARFGEPAPSIVRAPGRVNIIGEHTDYNDGFVFPMAINRATWIALRPRDDHQVLIYALNMDQEYSFSLDAMEKAAASPAEYIKGVAWALQQAGYTLTGWEGVIMGDVPIGSGLSSSAALELAAARAFSVVSGFDWDPVAMARAGQRSENDWLGLNCGIMDQMISAAGQAGHALLIDCRSLESELVPLPANTAIIVLDTGTRRGLVDNAYNERRQQCESAAAFFGVPALRDVTIEQFNRQAGALDELSRKRAKHVITENKRTLIAKKAMVDGDTETLGKLLHESHISLRDDFEVSSDALNTIVDIASQHEACYGARMTGAGFGGCAMALVDAAQAEDFATFVEKAYCEKQPYEPQVYICQAANGAEVIK